MPSVAELREIYADGALGRVVMYFADGTDSVPPPVTGPPADVIRRMFAAELADGTGWSRRATPISRRPRPEAGDVQPVA